MYCGCKTCCGRLTWIISILLLIAAVVGLALGLYFTVPCSRELVRCQGLRDVVRNGTQVMTDKGCWDTYWQCTAGLNGRAPGLYFFLAVAGAACLLLSLITCCCFCCQKNPRAKAAHKDHEVRQFSVSLVPMFMFGTGQLLTRCSSSCHTPCMSFKQCQRYNLLLYTCITASLVVHSWVVDVSLD